MKKTYLDLLNKQIKKLDDPEFDLDAWKNGASYLLRMIFGPKDPKIKEIDRLKIDYSSWTLRDASPGYKPIEYCKKNGKSVLEVAIDEIKTLGLPKKKGSMEEFLKEMVSESQFTEFIDPEATDKQRENILKGLTKAQLIELINKLY